MAYKIILLVLLESIPIIMADQKCYTNVSFTTGVAEICNNSQQFCCYDFSGEYYCCEENQLITIIKNSSIVLGTLFLLTLIIVGFCFVFVDFEADGGPSVVFNPPEPTAKGGNNEEGFSVAFKHQKDEKKIEKETEEKSEKQSDVYKPAWGQYDKKVSKQTSTDKIGFKQKSPKSVQSVEELKQKVIKSKSEEEKKGSKASQTKSFSKNVENLTKSINK